MAITKLLKFGPLGSYFVSIKFHATRLKKEVKYERL